MTCRYCDASNTADDHRCQRCGRRLIEGGNPYSRPVYERGAAARVLEEQVVESGQAPPDTEPARRTPPIQPSLFASRIVSFQSYAPESVETKPRAKSSATRKRAKQAPAGQESFRFDTVITPAEPAPKAPEPTITCEARVALPVHRILAASFDLSVVIVAVALFAAIFRLAGGQLLLSLHTLPFCLCVAAVFYLLYELLWCFADTDTAGMHWAQQTLVNFDGRRPTRDQRVMRVAFGCLSLLAGGLGIIWALVDEESLTWHDHMSRTFPTPS